MTDAAAEEMPIRVRDWLRQAFPDNTAKRVAQTFGASERTVEKWIDRGRPTLPSHKHLARMAARFGARFVAFVYEPAVGSPMHPYTIKQDLDDLKGQLEALERKLAYADAETAEQIRPLADEAARR